jgi:tight adherence protein C
MTPIGSIVLLTAVGVIGLLLVVSGWLQPAPSLKRVIEHLQRPGAGSPAVGASGSATAPTGARRYRYRLVDPLVRTAANYPRLLPSGSQLRLVGRSLEEHVIMLVLATVVGFVVPPLLVGLLQTAGLVSLGWFVPVIASLACAALGPIVVHTATIERAAGVRTDLRYQVSAYLDVVTMLLAGNAGYEGALEQAAHAGDGRLFAELRRRVRESGARGLSLTDALQRAGNELGLDELEQVAATAVLSAAEGAPVARTLAAKCATLRTALATEQEAEARLRTSRLTTPIVGMALIFMGLVIYPALSFA